MIWIGRSNKDLKRMSCRSVCASVEGQGYDFDRQCIVSRLVATDLRLCLPSFPKEYDGNAARKYDIANASGFVRYMLFQY